MHLTQNRPLYDGRYTLLDIGLASLLVVVWLATLIGGFSLPLAHTPLVVILLGVFVRTFAHTGLFIVAHEAIHRNISKHGFLNHLFGYLTSYLYALLPYAVLARNHRLHHRFPGTEWDPDSGHPERGSCFIWYCKFMKTYQTDGQIWVSMIGMAAIFCTLIFLHIPVVNLTLFWIFPMVASSLQLFIFGIFLPHRYTDSEERDRHQASSINLPVLWSFITCYHFGYHLEHHQYPYLPWYRLPEVYLDRQL